MEDRPCVFDVDGIQVRVIVDLSQLTSLVSLEHGLDSHGCFFFLVYLKTVTIGLLRIVMELPNEMHFASIIGPMDSLLNY